MQSAKNAAASVKETVQNIGASAKSGMGKTKATIQEKCDKMTAHDSPEKERAKEKKEERIHRAEMRKHEAVKMKRHVWVQQQVSPRSHWGCRGSPNINQVPLYWDQYGHGEISGI